MHPPLRRWAVTLGSGALAVSLLPLAPMAASAAPVATVAPAAAPAPVAGGTTVNDSLFPEIGNTGYDVRHYKIALAYAPDGSVKATTTIEAKADKKLSSFSLDLEGLEVDRVRVEGRDATFARTGTKLVVTPAKAAGGTFTVVVKYHGKPVTHIDPDGAQDGWVPSKTGATALSEPVGAQTWFPNNNTPRDKATFDVALTVPKKLAAASNGVLRSRKTSGGRTTWSWRQKQPMATYLSLAAIGDFDVYRSTVKLQHGRKITAWSFVQPSLGKAEAQRKLLPKVLAFSEKQYGRYPFDGTGMVIQDLGVGYALETQTRPFFDGVPDDSTLVHELAHQWFGDSVTPRDWGDIWLNEGFATYAEANWAAEHGGPTTWQAFQKTYDGNDASSDLWKPAPNALEDPADLFGEPVYTRGGLTLEALRHRIGDAKMKTLLRAWSKNQAGRSVRTSQFVALAEKVSDQDLGWFFRSWLEVPSKPAGY
ncbi:M1 family metallopeptidase [Microlunatus antarcticus]|uniref:Aminopeptidase N n=1 Tax=Microlunatus antarcticus TaxID=53388 RepID=A0A7W5JW40_9ACTN|nr:M1 family metallopeptidase [Microlunatus antarcticus]MBB3327390.1 aminopeptidase N [Microlunatus antarcticus]